MQPSIGAASGSFFVFPRRTTSQWPTLIVWTTVLSCESRNCLPMGLHGATWEADSVRSTFFDHKKKIAPFILVIIRSDQQIVADRTGGSRTHAFFKTGQNRPRNKTGYFCTASISQNASWPCARSHCTSPRSARPATARPSGRSRARPQARTAAERISDIVSKS